MATVAWVLLALLLPTAAMAVLIVMMRGGRGLAELRRKIDIPIDLAAVEGDVVAKKKPVRPRRAPVKAE